MKPFKFLLLFIFYSKISYSQNFSKSHFFTDANGTIYNRKLNAIGFSTPNTLDTFFDTLKKRYGTPIRDGYIFIYKTYNKQWAKERIIIRIEPSILINLDSSKLNDIIIFVETKNRIDLLNHKKKSYKEISKYFLNIFRKTVLNSKPDSFKSVSNISF